MSVLRLVSLGELTWRRILTNRHQNRQACDDGDKLTDRESNEQAFCRDTATWIIARSIGKRVGSVRIDGIDSVERENSSIRHFRRA